MIIFSPFNNFTNSEAVKLLTVYQYNNKIRLGANTDGGYVIGGITNVVYDCYLSCGVADEESFSRDFINKYKMNTNNSYAFDGSIEKYPTRFTDKITFFKKYIGNVNDENNTTMKDIILKYNNIFMKMDIEGGEYPWFEYIDTTLLNRFSQIVIELHNINNNDYSNKIKTLLMKLNTYHYIVHIHGNNCGSINNNIPDVIELTFINKKYFLTKPTLNTLLLPQKDLDYPNNLENLWKDTGKLPKNLNKP
jgi:hypothetical protein